MNLVIKRISETDQETFGVAILNNNPVCFTLEPPNLNNQNDVSRINQGTYEVESVIATEKVPYPHYHLKDVQGRDGILIHKGNSSHDTEGCILVGRQAGPECIALSAMALDDLRKLLPDNFTLTIKDVIS